MYSIIVYLKLAIVYVYICVCVFFVFFHVCSKIKFGELRDEHEKIISRNVFLVYRELIFLTHEIPRYTMVISGNFQFRMVMLNDFLN